MKTYGFRNRVVIPALSTLFCYLFLDHVLLADTSHYKELLIGDRGANMSGAYSAVADDATGAYHNPAGLVFGARDSMVALSNAANYVSNEYEDAVEDQAEEEEGWRYLINFAGYMKRFGDHVLGISYVIDDSVEVHQKQTFDNGLVLSKMGDDRTYKYGPSWAYRIDANLSVGVSLYLHHREYYQHQNRLYNTKEETGAWTYTNTEGNEIGIHPIIGIMWSPIDTVSTSFVFKNTYFTHSAHYRQGGEKENGSATISHTDEMDKNYRKMPKEYTMGIAWFPSSYSLYTLDLNYFDIEADDKVDVLNIAMGLEIYISNKFVMRGGFFTNKDNDVSPSSSTGNIEKIDMLGVSTGISIFDGPTMITAGAVFSLGSGKAQRDPTRPSEILSVQREMYSYSLAVSATFD